MKLRFSKKSNEAPAPAPVEVAAAPPRPDVVVENYNEKTGRYAISVMSGSPMADTIARAAMTAMMNERQLADSSMTGVRARAGEVNEQADPYDYQKNADVSLDIMTLRNEEHDARTEKRSVRPVTLRGNTLATVRQGLNILVSQARQYEVDKKSGAPTKYSPAEGLYYPQHGQEAEAVLGTIDNQLAELGAPAEIYVSPDTQTATALGAAAVKEHVQSHRSTTTQV